MRHKAKEGASSQLARSEASVVVRSRLRRTDTTNTHS